MATIPLGGDNQKAILAIMVGDKIRIGSSDHGPIEYTVERIEGSDSEANIYLQDIDMRSPQRVLVYVRVD